MSMIDFYKTKNIDIHIDIYICLILLEIFILFIIIYIIFTKTKKINDGIKMEDKDTDYLYEVISDMIQNFHSFSSDSPNSTMQDNFFYKLIKDNNIYFLKKLINKDVFLKYRWFYFLRCCSYDQLIELLPLFSDNIKYRGELSLDINDPDFIKKLESLISYGDYKEIKDKVISVYTNLNIINKIEGKWSSNYGDIIFYKDFTGEYGEYGIFNWKFLNNVLIFKYYQSNNNQIGICNMFFIDNNNLFGTWKSLGNGTKYFILEPINNLNLLEQAHPNMWIAKRG